MNPNRPRQNPDPFAGLEPPPSEATRKHRGGAGSYRVGYDWPGPPPGWLVGLRVVLYGAASVLWLFVVVYSETTDSRLFRVGTELHLELIGAMVAAFAIDRVLSATRY